MLKKLADQKSYPNQFQGRCKKAYLIPVSFLDTWRQFLKSPDVTPIPSSPIDNSPFLCSDHSRLLFDPLNKSDVFHIEYALLTMEEWIHMFEWYVWRFIPIFIFNLFFVHYMQQVQC